MGNIYRGAERVLIWLGPATAYTDFVMNTMKTEPESSLYSENRQMLLPQPPLNKQTLKRLGHLPDICPDRGGVYEFRAAQRMGLEMILSRSWFRRIWIIQEVANARSATIVCGTKTVSARIFAAFPSKIDFQLGPHCEAVLDIMPGISRRHSWWAEKRDLATLLLKFRGSEASDDRDSIFALLGIPSDARESLFLRADYNKDIRQIIGDTIIFLLGWPKSDPSIWKDFRWTIPQLVDHLSSPRLQSKVSEEASNTGQIELLRRLLDLASIEVNFKGPGYGLTALARAAKHGDEAQVRLLIGQEIIDLNERSSLLSFAATCGHYAVVKLLLEQPQIDVNSHDFEGQTAPYTASAIGQLKIVEMLIGHSKIDVNLSRFNGATPPSSASYHGHLEVVELLLKQPNIDINLPGSFNRTPLFEASRKGQLKVMEMLLRQSKIDVNLPDSQGRTPLVESNDWLHQGVVELLLRQPKVDKSGYISLLNSRPGYIFRR